MASTRTAARRPRTRSYAGGGRPAARNVHRASRHAGHRPDGKADARTTPGRCSRKCRAPTVFQRPIIVAIWGLESNFGRFTRRASHRGCARDAGVGPTARDASSAKSSSTRSRSSTAATSNSPHARLVGGRDGTAAVHALQLPAVRRGLRRRRPARHLEFARRHLRVDGQLPEGIRLGRRATAGDER